MMSGVIDADPADLRVGAPVKVCFAQWSPDIQLPLFRLTEDQKGESP